MKIAVPKERRPHERRVAASPETVKKLVGLGAAVIVEAGAGAGASLPDEAYREAGAEIAPDESAALSGADLVFKVQGPTPEELALMKPGQILVAMLNPLVLREGVETLAKAGVTAFAMELMPRITRAQIMDVL